MTNVTGRYSVNKFKRALWDISGAFGDTSVLFPIAVALILKTEITVFAVKGQKGGDHV